MTDPAVWTDAWARVQQAATTLNVKLLDPLDSALPTGGEKAFLFMESSAGLSDRLELGEDADDVETGQIWIHLMVPVGLMKTLDALSGRIVISRAFRRPALPLPDRLAYHGHDFDPPDSSATGNFYRFSLAVSYSYQSPS